MVQHVLRAHPSSGRVLDVGSGYGGMGETLSQYGGVVGIEPNPEAAAICLERGYQGVFSTMDEAIASRRVFDVIGAFDSLEHIQDDDLILKHIHSIMAPNGVFVITVPAYQRLWSKHDVEHQHFRRYTATSLREVLQNNGFNVRYIGYWNCFLFPLFFLSRILGIGGEGSLSSKWINAVFSKILRIESKLIPRFKLPFGSSVIALAVLR